MTLSNRLAATLLVSTIIHGALLQGEWIRLPAASSPEPVLSARLEAQPVAVQRLPETAPPPRRAAAARPLAAPPTTSSDAPAEFPLMTGEESAEPAAVATDGPPPVAVASAAPINFSMPKETAPPDFPRQGRIDYLLTMGEDATPIGRTIQTWAFEAGRYRIGNQAESTGLIELVRPHRYHYLSEGNVAEGRLRPERFIASIRRGGRTEESLAEFDWTSGQATTGRLPERRRDALPPGSQDLMSFIYSIALHPPAPGRLTLPFTRGSRLETVSFDVSEPEQIETALGRLRAIRVTQVREPEKESIALWFASDYRHLPVRIRFYGRDGTPVGEQTVTEIRVRDE